jgi:hypothetical protein
MIEPTLGSDENTCQSNQAKRLLGAPNAKGNPRIAFLLLSESADLALR